MKIHKTSYNLCFQSLSLFLEYLINTIYNKRKGLLLVSTKWEADPESPIYERKTSLKCKILHGHNFRVKEKRIKPQVRYKWSPNIPLWNWHSFSFVVILTVFVICPYTSLCWLQASRLSRNEVKRPWSRDEIRHRSKKNLTEGETSVLLTTVVVVNRD